MLRLMRIVFQLDVLEQDAFEVLRLIRSWKNRIAPVNRIPPEILSLVPDFLNTNRDEAVIALTHVCQAWREAFVSRPILWTNLDCKNVDKTRIYFERSKSTPIDLSIYCDSVGFFNAPLELIVGATGRLKSLETEVAPLDLQRISLRLSHPTPLLEALSIGSHGHAVLPSSLFNGDLSSLRELRLSHVHTELPWRNMVNLTSLALTYASPPVSLAQLLDFFESAPHLREIDILSSTPISGTQKGRLVPLASLQKMNTSAHPSYDLFDHLLIPVGAHLTMGAGQLPPPTCEGRPPKFIDNLGNLQNFTTIRFVSEPIYMQFSGPNGVVTMVSSSFEDRPRLESLGHFDTSTTETLELACCSSRDPFYQVLLPMKELRTLKLDLNACPEIVLDALGSGNSSSGVMACPRLEELVIVVHWLFDFTHLLQTAVARAAGGAKLKTVRISKRPGTAFPHLDILELEKHVSHVKLECEDDSTDGSIDSDEEN